MDWKEFISELVKALAWPSVVVFSLILLKDQFAGLLSRLAKFTHKGSGTELEFIKGVKELEQGSALEGTDKPESDEVKLNRNVLQRLAGISSRAAVIEAYRIVETSAVKAIQKAYPELAGKDIKKQVQVSKMLRDKILSPDRYFQLRELLVLRNKAAHDLDFSLSGSPIETYIDVSLSLQNELDAYEP